MTERYFSKIGTEEFDNRVEESRREKDFRRVFRKLNSEQQGVVSEVISNFMEYDQYLIYKTSPEKVNDLSSGLIEIGLKTKQRKAILRYLNLI